MTTTVVGGCWRLLFDAPLSGDEAEGEVAPVVAVVALVVDLC